MTLDAVENHTLHLGPLHVLVSVVAKLKQQANVHKYIRYTTNDNI